MKDGCGVIREIRVIISNFLPILKFQNCIPLQMCYCDMILFLFFSVLRQKMSFEKC